MIKIKKIKKAQKDKMETNRSALQPLQNRSAVWGVFKDGNKLATIKKDLFLPLWDVIIINGKTVYTSYTKEACTKWSKDNFIKEESKC